MTYLEELIHREAQRLALDLTSLARRAQAADVYLKATITPAECDLELYRAASKRETRATGETHVNIVKERYAI